MMNNEESSNEINFTGLVKSRKLNIATYVTAIPFILYVVCPLICTQSEPYNLCLLKKSIIDQRDFGWMLFGFGILGILIGLLFFALIKLRSTKPLYCIYPILMLIMFLMNLGLFAYAAHLLRDYNNNEVTFHNNMEYIFTNASVQASSYYNFGTNEESFMELHCAKSIQRSLSCCGYTTPIMWIPENFSNYEQRYYMRPFKFGNYKYPDCICDEHPCVKNNDIADSSISASLVVHQFLEEKYKTDADYVDDTLDTQFRRFGCKSKLFAYMRAPYIAYIVFLIFGAVVFFIPIVIFCQLFFQYMNQNIQKLTTTDTQMNETNPS